MPFIEMRENKELSPISGSFRCYRGERNADRLVFAVPRMYGGADLLNLTVKLCYRIGEEGTWLTLSPVAIEEKRVLYEQALTGAMVATAGRAVFWLEFLSEDGELLLRSGEDSFYILPREEAEALLPEDHLSVMSEWELKMQDYAKTAKEAEAAEEERVAAEAQRILAEEHRQETYERALVNQAAPNDAETPDRNAIAVCTPNPHTCVTGRHAVAIGGGPADSTEDGSPYNVAKGYKAIAIGSGAWVCNDWHPDPETGELVQPEYAMQFGTGINTEPRTVQFGGEHFPITRISFYDEKKGWYSILATEDFAKQYADSTYAKILANDKVSLLPPATEAWAGNRGNAGIGIGRNASTAGGTNRAIAIGVNTSVGSNDAVAIGSNAYASAPWAIQFGRGYNGEANTVQFGGVSYNAAWTAVTGRYPINKISIYQDAEHAISGAAGYKSLATEEYVQQAIAEEAASGGGTRRLQLYALPSSGSAELPSERYCYAILSGGALSLTFGFAPEGFASEWTLEVSKPTGGGSLSLPADISWNMGIAPTFSEGTTTLCRFAKTADGSKTYGEWVVI